MAGRGGESGREAEQRPPRRGVSGEARRSHSCCRRRGGIVVTRNASLAPWQARQRKGVNKSTRCGHGTMDAWCSWSLRKTLTGGLRLQQVPQHVLTPRASSRPSRELRSDVGRAGRVSGVFSVTARQRRAITAPCVMLAGQGGGGVADGWMKPSAHEAVGAGRGDGLSDSLLLWN